MMNLLSTIPQLIRDQLPDAKVETQDMTGTGDHIEILIVSDSFQGKTLLQQHRKIMDILKPSFEENLHAVKLTTLTYEKYKQRKIS